mmetsp:Transcript_35079/g.139275  ORF Transcript_35079/g.139275 Transcript_35079/m.139275 type:complete len:87 (-) Transcript_35079:1156-1416(-)
MDPDLVDDQSPANGAMEMDRSNASENVLALPELPPEVLDIIVRYSGVRSMIKLAQVGDARHRNKELSFASLLTLRKIFIGSSLLRC